MPAKRAAYSSTGALIRSKPGYDAAVGPGNFFCFRIGVFHFNFGISAPAFSCFAGNLSGLSFFWDLLL